MNIFILDTDMKQNAQYYCDKHLIKMILETAQLMCTVVVENGGTAPYKPTHRNHPCTKWLMENGANWDILYNLVTELNNEYKYRFNKTINHKSYDVICNLIKPQYSNNIFTGYFNAVTSSIQRLCINDTIKAYRKYYKEKQSIIDMKWTKRNMPEFLK